MLAGSPENFQLLRKNEQFCFDCHPHVTCFTECCRDLELELSPYDVLRLKNRLRINSASFLEKYVIIELDKQEAFPHCYLTMVDDGNAACVFISPAGCGVYTDRPGACRAYPVGRGASQNENGSIHEQYVLVKESHCKGFLEPARQNCAEYLQKQGLAKYNEMNDRILPLLKNLQIRRGFRPTREQLEQYVLALYNLDMFRQKISDGGIRLNRPLSPHELQALAGDDEKLLLLGIRWIRESWQLEPG